MAANYTAIILQDGEWWIGWVEEVPGVNSQGQTRGTAGQPPRRAGGGLGDEPCGGPRRGNGNLRGSEPGRMKRHDLISHLRRQGCFLIWEGRRHSWWGNPANSAWL